MGPINNIPALVQIMAWRRPGDKPLSEPMMVSLLMHICITQPQWGNNSFTLMLYCHYLNQWRHSSVRHIHIIKSSREYSEPMMVSLLTHICITQPKWVNNCFTLMLYCLYLNQWRHSSVRHRHIIKSSRECSEPMMVSLLTHICITQP